MVGTDSLKTEMRHSANEGTDRMTRQSARILPVALLALALAGCASTPSPKQAVTISYQVYVGLESALIQEQQAGHITADQHRSITPYRDAARAALDAANKAAVAGDPSAIDVAYKAAEAAVEAFAGAASRMTAGRVTVPAPAGGQ